MKLSLLVAVLLHMACSQQSETDTSNSNVLSKQSASGESRAEQAKSLLKKARDLMNFNAVRGKVFPKMGVRTVLEHHNSVFVQEELQATEETLEHYLVYVGCFQGLKYMRSGLYSSVDIGQFVGEIKKFDDNLFSRLVECSRENGGVSQAPLAFALTSNESDTVLEKVKRGAGYVLGFQSASAGEIPGDYSEQYCEDATGDICEAHEFASLGERACLPTPFEEYNDLRRSDPDNEYLKWPHTNRSGHSVLKSSSELVEAGFDCN